jgi:hypothetical protein
MKDEIEYKLLPIGTRIYNRGDNANISHYGTITGIEISKWGINYEITSDASAERNAYLIPKCMIKDVDTGDGLSRIVTESKKMTLDKKQIIEFPYGVIPDPEIEESIIIEKGAIVNIPYLILNTRGSHPCAYIGVYPYSPLYGIHYRHISNFVTCHGGLTYSDCGTRIGIQCPLWIFGWDYAHCDDFTWSERFPTPKNGQKKWTIPEIKEEIEKVISDFTEIELFAGAIEQNVKTELWDNCLTPTQEPLMQGGLSTEPLRQSAHSAAIAYWKQRLR